MAVKLISLHLIDLLVFFLSWGAVVSDKHQPNIVLIVADNLGWNDVGFHGSDQILTPNIDALAYNGIVLNRFYVQSTCTPSRSALLTGQYPIRYGFQGLSLRSDSNIYLPTHLKTLPGHLKGLGYTTSLVGKWHLGFSYWNSTPIYRGFDTHFGYWTSHIDYFSHTAEGGFAMRRNRHVAWETQNEYATRLFTRVSQETIMKHNYTNPLFLMVSHLAMHVANRNQLLQVPDLVETNQTFGYVRDYRRRLFAGMLAELDKSVGAICRTLRDRGVFEDTIILFLSDNGAQNTDNGFDNAGSNWPLRGMKATQYEGGVRSPAVLYYGKLKTNATINNQLMHITDLLPTLYAAAGGTIRDLGTIDGVNQWTTISEGSKSPRSSVLLDINEVALHSAVISHGGRYKLVNGSVLNPTFGRDGYYGNDTSSTNNPPYNPDLVLDSPTNKVINKGLTKKKLLQTRKKITVTCEHGDEQPVSCEDFCLFDLENDPCETKNLAENLPNAVADLGAQLLSYWEVLQPQYHQEIDPNANPIYYNNTWVPWMEQH
ncbi:hypothetical protein PPYR_07537 [Photinus pyralis]|uniref:Sulfatase N-terminal domain-containing protein n=2 Tax=Photinus pyralis TaxID=7054 RepID=A0A5N4AQQ4_PHOPY|nr:arylsulfatase B-like [Photinus pyralis]KAB0799657.1 hypothetical protein PPYR_07537 [Photinus pyralis]